MLRTFFITFFPFWMLCVEWVLRLFAAIDARNFLGPSLAAIGLGFIVPALEHSTAHYPIERVEIDRLARRGYRVSSSFDDFVVDLALVAMLLGILLWMVSLYWAEKKGEVVFLAAPLSLWPGVVTAMAGIVLYLLKPRST